MQKGKLDKYTSNDKGYGKHTTVRKRSPRASLKLEVDATGKGKCKVVAKYEDDKEALTSMVVVGQAFNQWENILEVMFTTRKIYSNWDEIPIIARMTRDSNRERLHFTIVDVILGGDV